MGLLRSVGGMERAVGLSKRPPPRHETECARRARCARSRNSCAGYRIEADSPSPRCFYTGAPGGQPSRQVYGGASAPASRPVVGFGNAIAGPAPAQVLRHAAGREHGPSRKRRNMGPRLDLSRWLSSSEGASGLLKSNPAPWPRPSPRTARRRADSYQSGRSRPGDGRGTTFRLWKGTGPGWSNGAVFGAHSRSTRLRKRRNFGMVQKRGQAPRLDAFSRGVDGNLARSQSPF
jgi:hypothetical protein